MWTWSERITPLSAKTPLLALRSKLPFRKAKCFQTAWRGRDLSMAPKLGGYSWRVSRAPWLRDAPCQYAGLFLAKHWSGGRRTCRTCSYGPELCIVIEWSLVSFKLHVQISPYTPTKPIQCTALNNRSSGWSCSACEGTHNEHRSTEGIYCTVAETCQYSAETQRRGWIIRSRHSYACAF